jgi:hypothetical protein
MLKQGPFEPQIFSEFALWSPEEGSPEVRGFMERHRAAGKGDSLV